MKAVNLIPAEEQRAQVAGRSGGGVYVLLGVLGLLVVLATAYAVAGNTVEDRRTELTQVRADTKRYEATVKALEAYTSFTKTRAEREETVGKLAASRFDWAGALREVARTVPTDTWLTTMTGTLAPGVNAGGASDPLRSALPNPAISVTGCTTSHRNVARVLSAMRAIDGVERVSLSSSEKVESASTGAGGPASAGGNSSDCRNGSDKFPQFSMTIFFRGALAAPAATAGGTK